MRAWRSSLFLLRTPPRPNFQVRPPSQQHLLLFLGRHSPSGNHRYFSSADPSIDPTATTRDREQQLLLLTNVLSKPIDHSQIKAELGSLDLALDKETVGSVLAKLQDSPGTAALFFEWASSKKGSEIEKGSALGIELVRSHDRYSMQEGRSRRPVGPPRGHEEARLRHLQTILLEGFKEVQERGDGEELGSLNEMYCLSSVKDVSGRICKILKKEEEPEAIRQALQELGVTPCADSIVDVLDRVGTFPKRAMVFYQWVEKISSLEIDGKIYNAMARVLGREDCVDDFWVLLHKMRSCGFGLEMETISWSPIGFTSEGWSP
ncbi:pentatricopeptide repeat-containing protein-like, mitochondrial [Iris pallida]|uniref:Pentatricopeptide repeat-containing protein-like, mitochondrial n=1 Tax=Iris pallida TaxID=29817 RepID=A0AAX6HLK0_IRIPA|nr:pentatricopeptide repeat-containing protein-like, mitochondrial [Iris pallida]